MYLLHVTYPTGTVQTIPFHSAFLRGLAVVMLAGQDVTIALSDGVA
jgi:hypothetical protein